MKKADFLWNKGQTEISFFGGMPVDTSNLIVYSPTGIAQYVIISILDLQKFIEDFLYLPSLWCFAK